MVRFDVETSIISKRLEAVPPGGTTCFPDPPIPSRSDLTRVSLEARADGKQRDSQRRRETRISPSTSRYRDPLPLIETRAVRFHRRVNRDCKNSGCGPGGRVNQWISKPLVADSGVFTRLALPRIGSATEPWLGEQWATNHRVEPAKSRFANSRNAATF